MFNSNDSTNLSIVERVLGAQFEREPVPFTPETANGTRNVSNEEIAYGDKEKLLGVAACPDIAKCLVFAVERLISAKVKTDLKSADGKDWLARINPMKTPAPCPLVIHSEMDTRTWVWETLLKPSLQILWSCMSEKVTYERPLRTSLSLGNISVPSGTPIPDERLYVASPEEEGEETNLQTFEFKTANALGKETFQNLFGSMVGGKTEKVTVIPFAWPRGRRGVNKQTRILVQVYAQMLKHKVKYSTLTSFSSTVFLYLDAEKQLLYISREHHHSDRGTFMVFFAWFALSAGLDADLAKILKAQLPKLDDSAMKKYAKLYDTDDWTYKPVGALPNLCVVEPDGKETKAIVRRSNRLKDQASLSLLEPGSGGKGVNTKTPVVGMPRRSPRLVEQTKEATQTPSNK